MTPKKRFSLTAILCLFVGALLFIPLSTYATQPSQPSPTEKPKYSCEGVGQRLIKESTPLFPFIVDATIETKPNGGKICNISHWDIPIIEYYLRKLVAIISYTAGTACVLLIMWGGVIYIRAGSTANPDGEGKKARGIITGALIGLLIVSFAALIVGGSFFIFGNSVDFQAVETAS